MNILNVLKTEAVFELEYMYQKVTVEYNYFGLSKVKDETRLPIISHIKFHCSPNFRAFTDTGFKSFFFPPSALEGYTNIAEVAKDILEMLTKEEAKNTPAALPKVAPVQAQLSLF